MKQYEVKVETKHERQARERELWVIGASAYLVSLGVFTEEEKDQADELAASILFCNCIDCHTGEIEYSVKEAIDEEMTYWGE